MMNKRFVAINYIDCEPDYIERFEFLFGTRAKAIDLMPGFMDMEVLKPNEAVGSYLIISHWESEESFKAWTNSPAFLEGHRRGFEDIKKAKEEGKKSPMRSTFKTYTSIAN
jgi:heme oxygenase (mycobilin-producing)